MDPTMALITPRSIKNLETVLDLAREEFGEIEGYTAWTTQRVHDRTEEIFSNSREAVAAGHGRTAYQMLQDAAMLMPDSDAGRTLWLTVLSQAMTLTQPQSVGR